MKYAICYASKTGNTKQLAEAIRESLPEEDLLYYGSCDPKAYEADRIYLGFWCYKADCSEDVVAFLEGLHGKELFLFGTAGFGNVDAYFQNILDRVKRHIPADVTVTDTFMCQGKMPGSVREKYVKMKETATGSIPNWDEMIENFDCAVTHPDQADLEHLKAKIKA